MKVRNGVCLLSDRRFSIVVTENVVSGGGLFRLGATGVDELKALAILQRTLHDEVTSDCIVLEAFEHFTRKELQVKSTGVTRSIGLTSPCKASGQIRRLMCHFFGIKLKRYLRLSNVQENFLWSIPTV